MSPSRPSSSRGADVLLRRADRRLVDLAADRLGVSPDDLTTYAAAGDSDYGIHSVRSAVPAATYPWFADLPLEFATESIDLFEKSYPGALGGLIPGVDLASLARLRLALHLAYRELPILIAFLGQRGESPDSHDDRPHRPQPRPRVALVGFSLAPGQVERLDTLVNGAPTMGSVVQVAEVRTDLLEKTHRYFRRGQPVGASNELSLALATDPGPASMVVLGAETDRGFLEPLTRLLSSESRVVALAKNDRPDTSRGLEALSAAGAGRVIRAADRTELRGSRDTRVAVSRGLATLVEQHRDSPVDLVDFGLTQFAGLLPVLRDALSYEAITALVRPRLIAGAFDSGVLGPALVAVSKAVGSRVVNFQHGTLSPLGASLAGDFDLSLVWNERSRRSFIEGGADSGSLVVVGNPRWEALAVGDAPPGGEDWEALRRWKSHGLLLVLFPQPEKGPFLGSGDMAQVYRWCAEVVEERPATKLLVKQRAAGATGGEEALSSLVAEDRVRFASAEDLSLAAALDLADLAVSIFSTALADAVAAGVRAASLHVGGVLDALRPDFFDAVDVCSNADEFGALVDSLMGESVSPIRPPSTDFLPVFAEPYSRRLRAALVQRGLWPA